MKITIVFGKLPPNVMGMCNYNTKVITIDLAKDQRSPGMVLIHELTHLHYPWMEEDEVIARSWFQWHNMNRNDRLELLRQLFRRAR